MYIKKSGECKRCYHHRYNVRYHKEHYIPKPPRVLLTEEEKREHVRSYAADYYERVEKQWRKTPEGRAARALSRERYRAKHGDPTKPERAAKRRALAREAQPVPLRNGYRQYLLSLWPACLNCGTIEQLEIDHVIPLSIGGKHHYSNFQVLCRSCNARKNNVDQSDYRLYQVIDLW